MCHFSMTNTTATIIPLRRAHPYLQQCPQYAIQSVPLWSRVLDLTDCRGVDGEALLQALQAGLPKLATLFLDGIMEVTDAWLGQAAPKLAHLRELSISHCSSVTDAGVTAVATACRQLAVLRVNGVTRLTDAAMVALADGCPNLQVGLTSSLASVWGPECSGMSVVL